MDKDETFESVRQIERNLRRVDHIIRKKGRQILKDFDITVPQFEALQYLFHNEKHHDQNMTIGQLSHKMHLAFSTVTDLIDRMENAELVSRKKDPIDKRIVRLEVLEKGYAVLDNVLTRRIEYLSDKLASLSNEEKEKLDRILQRLHEVMDEDRNQ